MQDNVTNIAGGAAGSGNVAARRLRQMMDNASETSKQRHRQLIEVLLNVEKAVRSQQETIASLREEIKVLNDRNSDISCENQSLTTVVLELTEVANKAAEMLSQEDNEREDLLSRLDDLVADVTAENTASSDPAHQEAADTTLNDSGIGAAQPYGFAAADDAGESQPLRVAASQ